MKNTRPKRRKALLILTTFIVLAVAFVLLLPTLFQLPVVQEKTRAFLTRQTGGTIAYEKETLTLFPWPCIHLHDVHLKNGERYSGAIEEVSAVPHLLSLLRGRFNISKISIKGVEASAQIPKQTSPPSLTTILGTARQNLEAGMGMLAPVRQNKFILDIENATLTLTRAGKPFFLLKDINAELYWQRPVMSLKLSDRTGLWEKSTLVLDTNVITHHISGRLTADKFTPAAAWEYLFPTAAIHLDAASLDADVSWETDDFKTWRFGVTTLNPDITLRKKTSSIHLQGKKVTGEMRIDKTGVHASISELDLDDPGLRLTGEFHLNTDSPSAGWRINADKLDIASTRAAALFFAGQHKTAQNICDVLRSGDISGITMGQEARSLDELRRVSCFHLQGLLDHAAIDVPHEELHLTESSGKVTVSDGVLHATDVRTRLGNSTGTGGSFTLGLEGHGPKPFRVACDVQADLAELPPLLGRLTKNTLLAEEMAAITSAEGSANGSMVLDSMDEPFQVTVDVSKFDLSAAYQRIPYPITLSGGRFFYQGKGLRVQDIQGSIGGSRITGLTAGISWEESPRLNISSAQADVDVRELSSWLGGVLTACREAGTDPADSGLLHVAHLQFSGPVLNPQEWQFQADGSVTEKATVCTPLFPEALTVYGGSFAATQEKIDVSDADLSILGSRLLVTGSLEGYLTHPSRVLNARIEGSLGPDISKWIYGRTGIPDIFRWKTPIQISPLSLKWYETEGLNLSGEAVSPGGPSLSFDIDSTASAFTIGRLVIRDGAATAEISLTRNKKSLAVSFSGNLDHETASKILAENKWLKGSIHGNADVHLDMTPPYMDSITGRIEADGIDFSTIGWPLEITRAILVGSGDAVNIADSRFTWKKKDFLSSGKISRTGHSLLLDMSLSTETLDLPEVKSLIGAKTFKDSSVTSFLTGDIRFTCGHLTLDPPLTFAPFEARLKMAEGRTDIVVEQANACGISFPGTLTLTPDRLLFSFKPTATGKPLAPTISCLQKGKMLIDGNFDLTGDLSFQWDESGSLLEAIEGNASLTAKDGRIYRATLLGKLFSMLNISKILTGQFPDLEKEGFPYSTCKFSGKFKSGTFELEKGVIDSPAMKIFFEGDENIVKKEHQLTIVVAPLPTVDSVVDKIPVVNDVLDKGLVVYPVKVRGGWDDPHLTLLSPTAVGGEVMGIMLRTLKLPVTILEKILPGSKSE